MIATDRRHVYQVHSFSELDSIHEEVVRGICASKILPFII